MSGNPTGATYDKLKKFLEETTASRKALSHLRRGVEISIVIGRQIECALFNDNGLPKLEQRPAKNHDVVFYVKPESVEILVKNAGDDVGDLGIAVLKEYLAGGVRIQVVGSIFGIMKNGYMNIIKEGGGTFAKFLAGMGLTNISKVMGAIKSLKKET